MIRIIHTIIGFFLVGSAYAAGDGAWSEYYAPFGGSGSGRAFINDWAARVGNMALLLITGGSVIAIMWGGLKLITSAGNDEGKESAKKIVMYTVGGLLLAIMSKSIIDFTKDFVEAFTPTT